VCEGLDGFCFARGGSGFLTGWLSDGWTEGERSAEPTDLVADADEEHGLFGGLQDINDAIIAVFEVDGFAIGDEMDVLFAGEDVVEAPTHLLLEKLEYAADFLEREAFAPEFGDNGNFHHLFRQVHTFVTLMAGRHYFTFIPPLELPETHLRDTGDIAACERLLGRERFRTALF